MFTITPEHFADLKHSKKVIIETTAVDGHKHKLFIDPTTPKWRVPGAAPTEVVVDPSASQESPQNENVNIQHVLDRNGNKMP